MTRRSRHDQSREPAPRYGADRTEVRTNICVLRCSVDARPTLSAPFPEECAIADTGDTLRYAIAYSCTALEFDTRRARNVAARHNEQRAPRPMRSIAAPVALRVAENGSIAMGASERRPYLSESRKLRGEGVGARRPVNAVGVGVHRALEDDLRGSRVPSSNSTVTRATPGQAEVFAIRT